MSAVIQVTSGMNEAYLTDGPTAWPIAQLLRTRGKRVNAEILDRAALLGYH